jgi:hypothetical protein
MIKHEFKGATASEEPFHLWITNLSQEEEDEGAFGRPVLET